MNRRDDTAALWPYRAAEANPKTWCLTTEEHAEYCLGVLPPIYFPGGFAVSEPIRDGATGAPVYLCVARFNGRPYVAELTIAEATQAAPDLRHGLCAQVSA